MPKGSPQRFAVNPHALRQHEPTSCRGQTEDSDLLFTESHHRPIRAPSIMDLPSCLHSVRSRYAHRNQSSALDASYPFAYLENGREIQPPFLAPWQAIPDFLAESRDSARLPEKDTGLLMSAINLQHVYRFVFELLIRPRGRSEKTVFGFRGEGPPEGNPCSGRQDG